LRNPVERAISAWKMYNYHFSDSSTKFLIESRDFQSAIANEIDEFKGQNRFIDFRCYVKRGMYSEQIEKYFKHFPQSQFLFIESQQLRNEFEKSVNKILTFLELPIEKLTTENQNESQENFDYQANKETILNLKEIFESENQKLYKLIKEKYNWD
jgi:lipopolysaccharide transport system ATP-binding protein